MNTGKHKKNTVLIVFILLLTLINGYGSVQGEIKIRIIQGSAFITGFEGGPLEPGTFIRMNVSDGQQKIVATHVYDEDSDLNFGAGFTSIDEGNTVTFSIFYQGRYQEPTHVWVNNNESLDKKLSITSDDIYHITLHLDIETIPLPVPGSPDPSDTQQQVSIAPTLRWECNTSTVDQPRYTVYLSTNGVVDETHIVEANISQMQYPLESLAYETTYYWKVQIKDSSGNTQNSSLWSFTTISNLPPYQPTNPVPTHESGNRPKNQVLSWSCSDPEGDALTYDVYFGKTTDPEKKASKQTTTRYEPGLLDHNTTYYWRIVAWDTHNQSNTSPLWRFTVSENNMKPLIPSNPQPSNGTKGVSINSTLTWTGGDQDGDTVTYDIYLSTTTPPTLLKSKHTTTTYTVQNLTYNTTYYWKIISTDALNASQSGPIWSFVTKKEDSLAVLKADAGGPYTGFVGETITFDASKSKDKARITGYRWDFTNDGSWDTDWLSSPTTSYVFNNIFSGTVKVQVKDTDNKTDNATSQVSITTANTPPTEPSIQGPLSGKTNTSISLSIVSTDPDGDQLTYHIDWNDGSLSTTLTAASGVAIDPTHVYKVPGLYTISVTVTDPSNAKRYGDHFISITKESAATGKTEESGGFPWFIIILLIIIVVIAGLIFYLYKNDRLPIGNKQRDTQTTDNQSVGSFFANPFNKNKNEYGPTNQTISDQRDISSSHPTPVQSAKEADKPSRLPKPFTTTKSKPLSSNGSDTNTSEGQSGFKRL